MSRPAGGLEGHRILVTGGGTGIGAACALQAAVDGASVVICGRTESTLRAAATTIAEAAQASGRGGSVRHVLADVTVEEDVARLVADAAADGELHGVVANAGGGGGLAPFHRQDVAAFQQVLTLNVVGTLLLAKHSVPSLARTGGSFVGMSSLAGGTTHRFFGAYPVAKAGLEELVRTAADEYGVAGVRFNAVRPGFTATELMALIPREGPVFGSYLENTPLPGVGEPEDVAQLVRFLLGPESRWITGQVIGVDGGHHLRRGPDFGSFVAPADDDPLPQVSRVSEGA